MKTRQLLIISLFACLSLFAVLLPNRVAWAITLENADITTDVDSLYETEVATPSAQATESSKLASPSAEIVERIQERKDQDITETSGKQKTKLETFLDENPPSELSWHNFLQHAIRRAVSNGLASNVVVLLLLFPLIAAVISIARHIIGLQSFGIYIPAVLSVALVSTGINMGLSIFFILIITTLVFRRFLKFIKLQLLPRTAMLLWSISISILAIFIFSSSVGSIIFLNITIFPLLILMLLTENFIETQLASSQSQAVRYALETIFVALICSLLISYEPLQKFALLNPEVILVSVPVINIIVGRYSGLRLLEYLRFKSIIDR